MKSALILIFLVASCSAVAKSEESTETSAPSDHSEERDVAGTIDPKKPLNVDAPVSMCKPNETYTTCGTSCELSCDNQLPSPCLPACIKGCQCSRGYYRNRQRYCVLLKDCPPRDSLTCANAKCLNEFVCRMIDGKPQCVPDTPQCKANESYKTCGTACEPTCDKPIPGACTDQCVVGCQCNTGYYRNKQGNCVRLTECPPGPITCANILCMVGYICKESGGKAECVPAPQFKPNESYLTCGTACEPSCDNPNPTVCTDNCVAGCQCNRGYYRNKLLGSCVLLKDCPPKCKANESHHFCERECEPSCEKPNPTGCSDNCITGCLCDSGYYRDKQGNCIRLADCPPNAPTCAAVQCQRGNICKIVNGKAQCVPDIPTCKANEVYTQCKSACEPSCEKPNPTICPDICRPGCQCIKDYYRNSNGDCVRLNQCPPKEPAACQGKQCTTPGGCALVIPVTCIIGLCTPQPQCVNSNPCASRTCETGKDCVLRQVICIRPPCNPTAECITSTTCGPNEMPVPCKNSCSERRCVQTPQVFCPPICIGSPGCACKSGYLRNPAGRCVTQQQC